MTTDVTFRGIEPSRALIHLVETCAARLDRVFSRIERCDVTIDVPHRHQDRDRTFHVRIVLTVPGKVLAATRDPLPTGHDSAYLAVSDAFRVIRRQLAEYAHQREEARRSDDVMAR